MSSLRTVFLGTADLARASLLALVHAPDIELLGVVSQPDKAQGRKLRTVPTAVKAAALEQNLPVWQPTRLRRDHDLIARLKDLDLDVLVVAAYGQILPESVLEIPRLGCVNVHTSLLPKYRGAAPIQWAILNGETETGVTIMQMDAGMDTGPILSQRATPIDPKETGGELHDRLASLGAELLLETLPGLSTGTVKPIPQDESAATHARKLNKADSVIDWSRPHTAVADQIRGLNPWPGTVGRILHRDQPKKIKLWQATPIEDPSPPSEPGTILAANASGIDVACGSGVLRLLTLQREGGKRLDAGPFLAGFPLSSGERWLALDESP